MDICTYESLWRCKQDVLARHDGDLRDTLTRVVNTLFAKYDRLRNEHEETMSFTNQGSTESSHRDTASMTSESSVNVTREEAKLVHFEDSDSEESMSLQGTDLCDADDLQQTNTGYTPWRVKRSSDKEQVTRERSRGTALNTSEQTRCMRCEAYDVHCKAAAENYRRTLNSYTKTVSELMIGFKTVLERYPELKHDSTDEHLYYMVQSALGRNNLVQEMVRLSAKRHVQHTVTRMPQDEVRDTDQYLVTMQEALNTCYSDSEALRMTLKRYTDLYVRYIEVWREMCSKVTRDITVLEFVNMTHDRPGVSHGEPWSEAKAYLARMIDKMGSITPRSVSEACTRALKSIQTHLSYAPTDFTKRKAFIQAWVDEVRDHLDSSARNWSWDSNMNDIYLDIRSDLTIVDTLVGLGEISVKTLLQERSMLISQLRKHTRNQGTLELQLTHIGSKLRDTKTLQLYPEMY